MGGLAPRVGLNDQAVYRTSTNQGVVEVFHNYIINQFLSNLNYLRTNKLLSVNPLSSGGVGKKVLMFR